jgi:acetyltransferase-like isoleucine patch superfamily enzyme
MRKTVEPQVYHALPRSFGIRDAKQGSGGFPLPCFCHAAVQGDVEQLSPIVLHPFRGQHHDNKTIGDNCSTFAHIPIL